MNGTDWQPNALAKWWHDRAHAQQAALREIAPDPEWSVPPRHWADQPDAYGLGRYSPETIARVYTQKASALPASADDHRHVWVPIPSRPGLLDCRCGAVA